MVKRLSSKLLAGFLAFAMAVSVLPVSIFTIAFAETVSVYKVRLTDGTSLLELNDVEVTLYDKADSTPYSTHTVDGIAVFSNVISEEKEYTVSVGSVVGYDDVTPYDHTVSISETGHDITMTALETVTVSGKVTDENDAPYEGAAVSVSGYFTYDTVTDENGEYSINAYKGKLITITASPKTEDASKYDSATVSSTAYTDNVSDANLKLTLKKFNVTTNSATIVNGNISSGVDVDYGGQTDITVAADDGYLIEKVTVNGTEVSEAADKENYVLSLTDIKENYDVVASFYRMTYKVTFTVGENGEVKYGAGTSDVIVGGSVNVDKIFNESVDPSEPTKVVITATPNSNYRVSKVIIDGGEPLTFTENDKEYETDLIMTENHSFVVEFSLNEYTLKVDAGSNGTAAWENNVTKVSHGDNAKLIITSNNGYRIEKVTVNGTEVSEAADEKNYVLSLTDIKENYVVVASFYRMTYKVTFTVGENGEVKYGAGTSDVIVGGSVNVEKIFNESVDPSEPTKAVITATPNSNYRVSKVIIDGGEPLTFTENDKVYNTELTMTENHSFEVEFSLNEYTLNVNAGSNGTAAWENNVTKVSHGDNAKLIITSNYGYRIEKVTVNGTEVSEAADKKNYTLSLTDIKENYVVVASFYRMTYKVTFTVGENGEVTYGTGTSDVIVGGSVNVDKIFNESDNPSEPTKAVITAIPNDNYRVSKVIIDGGKPLTFTENNKVYDTELKMDKNHSFVVEFSLNKYTLKVDAGSNGTAVWENNVSEVSHGDNAKLIITPNNGYAVETITVNGSEATGYSVDENGIFSIGFNNISENKTVAVTFATIISRTPSDKFSNDYYTVTFSADAVNEYTDGSTNVVVLPKDATATISPVTPYTGVKYNSDSAYGGYSNSVTIDETTSISNIIVQKSNDYSDIINIPINVKIIIDKDAPVIDDIPVPGWTNSNKVTISGKVTDEGYSGLNYIVWSKDASLTKEAVLAETEHKASIIDGAYSFDVAGEQNSTYYVYAVDNAGNVSNDKTVDVKIDTKPPVVDSFVFSTDINSSINFTPYATISKDTIYVTVTASDKAISSEVEKISLYYGGEPLVTKEAKGGSATFELKEDKFSDGKEIYAVAFDGAGNHSKNTKPTDTETTEPKKILSDIVQISSKKSTTIGIDNAKGVVVGGNSWYNGDVEFTVTVSDDVGIKSIEVKMNGKDLNADLTSPTPVDLNQDFSKNGKITEKKLTFNTSQNTNQNTKDGKNTIEVTVTNAAGVQTTETKDVYIDTTEASVDEYDIQTVNNRPLDKVLNFLTFGIFFNEQVKITVTASDKKASSGVKSITLSIGEKKYGPIAVDRDNKATFIVTTATGQVYTGDISAVATDNVGNTTATPVIPTTANSKGLIKNNTLMLETVAPTVNVQFASAASGKNEATKDKNDWYKDNVEFTVTAGDANSGIRNVVITINDKQLVNESYYKDAGTDTKIRKEAVFKVNTAKADRAADGSYTIKVSVTDNAGNVNNFYSKTIYKDVDVPYITGFDFVPKKYIEGSETVAKDAVVSTDYGFYFKTDTDVIISAKDVAPTADDVPTAGIKSITYYTVDFTSNNNGVKSAEKTVSVNADNQITVTIPANFKGQIYAKATDNVDNTTAKFVNPNSAIVENADKHKTEEHISFTKADTAYTTNDGTELYSGNVDVTVTVSDTYSGIRDIEWSVIAPYDTVNNKGGAVTINNDKSFAQGSDSGWTQTKSEANLVTEIKKTITVNNNSNNIIVKVKMTDRAGNTSEKQIEFSIDKIAPTIDIVYGSNEVHDSQYTDHFSTKRTATITITERNFRASDVASVITNTDAVIPGVDLSSDAAWITNVNTADPDKTTHTAVVEYTADGDYTFDISYKDNAENQANKIAQHKFTIDMTKPVVSVSYNNNSAANGNYYKADRVATITIKEHNFDASRVRIIGTASDNGAAAVFPTASAWSSVGDDTYSATIAYTSDAKYSFDIEFRDKANNSIDNFTVQEFYVDKTAPKLEISGVADKSANNGDVIPVITYSDTNFDKDTVSMTLTGANNGAVKYEGTYTDILNGQVFTYNNFEKAKNVDDIYTLTVKLTDKAGNETEKKITFSVNRFGSVYDISGVKDIIGKYLKSEKNIVFTETNVDSLDREDIIVKLTKNGTPTDLVEGTDYTVDIAGGDGKWSVYTYTIKSSLFSGDGRYIISVYSKDAAGNVNENINENKKAEISFGIDKTAPVIVPVDFESGAQYPVETKEVSVEIKDNLVLDNVKIYLNGNEIEFTEAGENFTFNVPESDKVQDAKIVAVDAAGNEYTIDITDILVSTNVFVRWYNNTPLFVGTIIGVVVLVLGIIFLIFLKKKKKADNE